MQSNAARTFGRVAPSPHSGLPNTAGEMLGRTQLRGAFAIELSRIVPDPGQVRRSFDQQAIKELAASITELGVLQPISVRYDVEQDRYVVIAGERRFRAARLLKLREIPCLIQNPQQQRVLLTQVTENWQRQDLDPTEIANALVALQETYKLTQEDLVRLTGKPKSEISKHLAIGRNVDVTVRQLAERQPDRLTKRHLYNLSQLPAVEQKKLASQVIEQRLTAQDTEQRVARAKERLAGVKPTAPPTVTRRFETTHGVVLVRTKSGRRADAYVMAALDEARRQLTTNTRRAD